MAAHALPVELPEGPPFYRFADVDECRRTLAEGGFDVDSLRSEKVVVTWRVPSAALLYEAEIRAGVRTGAVVRAQPADRLDAIRKAIVEGVQAYADGEDFALPIAARVTAARAPAG